MSFSVDPENFELRPFLEHILQYKHEHGIATKQLGVSFDDLTVKGKNSAASVVKDIPGLFFPWFFKLKSKIKHERQTDLSHLSKTRYILKDISGYAKPGSLTMVLGRPGSGCSTFLKTLSGQTATYTGVEGDLNYDGISRQDMAKKFPQEMIYVPEVNNHFPYLTVEQTLRFAITSKTPNVRVDGVSKAQYIDTMEKMVSTILGLGHVQNTRVGNDFIRGVSGGERKRVSIGEAMLMNGTVFCYDNSTRGLDASTALNFTKSMETWAHVTGITCFMTAYQASEKIFDLFDQVLILYMGREVYFGPRDEAVQYFIDLGFEKNPRISSSEFLTAVTDPLQRYARKGSESKVPTSVAEFEECWHNSEQYQRLQDELNDIKSKRNGTATEQMLVSSYQSEKGMKKAPHSKYTISYLDQLKLCCTRSVHNAVNSRAYEITQCVVALIQAIVIGSLYFNIPNTTAGIFSKAGTRFFSILYFVIMGLADIASQFSNRPIMNKQRGYVMYHPSADMLSARIVQYPIRLTMMVLFSVCVYFLAGLKQQAGVFFIFVLFLTLTMEIIATIFNIVCSFTPTVAAANGLAGVLMMMMILYSSFMIQRPSMYWWFKWFSYINPFLYGFESSITSEFHGDMMQCSAYQLIPSGGSYDNVSSANKACAVVGAQLTRKQFPSAGPAVNGDIYLKLAYDYSYTHIWRNLGILFGMLVGFLAINALIVELHTPVVASADKLLLVRGSKLPSSILEIEQLNPDSSSSSSGDLENSTKVTPKATIGRQSTDETEDQSSHMYNRISALRKLHRQDYTTSDHLGSHDVFAWRNINYSVPYAGSTKQLLQDMEGYILPGTMTALMGESGAGKTTLLNTISQRDDVGVVTGDFFINGKPLDKSFERRIGYVQQQDLHIAELTVRESLQFAARLRRPVSVPDDEKIAYVEKVIRILHMEDYADAIAGQPGYGLNVEQRKKLSIATELVAKPTLLLLLDEPTSGLDSQSAWSIVQLLRELADAGQAILCTIHQPSSSLFEQFDRLLLLQSGGRMVYFGDIGQNSSTVIDYFESHGARKCLPNENCAEYMLEVIGVGQMRHTDKDQDWGDVWSQSTECVDMQKQLAQIIDESSRQKDSLSKEELLDLQSTYATPYYYQLSQVLHRTWIQFSRDLGYFMSKFGLSLIGGLVHGFSYWDIKHTAIGMQNTMFANFMPIVISSPLTNQIQAHAIASRELFEVRESRSNTFHWSTLLLSQFICEIPYAMIVSTIYYICWYFPLRLPLDAATAGFWWMTYAIFFQLYYISFGLGIVYFCPDLPTANVILGVLLNFIISFCGVMQPPSLIPHFWKFMWRASPYTYFVESMAGTCLHNRKVVCSSSEMNYLNPPNGETCGKYLSAFFQYNNGYVADPNATSNCGVCPYSVGDEYLKTVGMFFSHRNRNIAIFIAYIVFNLSFMLVSYSIFRVHHWTPVTPIKRLIRKVKK